MQELGSTLASFRWTDQDRCESEGREKGTLLKASSSEVVEPTAGPLKAPTLS